MRIIEIVAMQNVQKGVESCSWGSTLAAQFRALRPRCHGATRRMGDEGVLLQATLSMMVVLVQLSRHYRSHLGQSLSINHTF